MKERDVMPRIERGGGRAFLTKLRKGCGARFIL